MRSALTPGFLAFLFFPMLCSANFTHPAIEDCNASITSPRDSICGGDNTQLFAGNEADVYMWSPTNSIVGGPPQSPVVQPNVTTTYTLTTIDLEEELIVNGNFESGNTGFSSDYEVGSGGPFGELSDEGTFGI